VTNSRNIGLNIWVQNILKTNGEIIERAVTNNKNAKPAERPRLLKKRCRYKNMLANSHQMSLGF